MGKIDELIQQYCPDGVEYIRLGEVAKVCRGTRVVKSQLSNEGYPVYQNCLTPMGYFDKTNCPGGTPFVICGGAAGNVGYADVDCWAADDCEYIIAGDGVCNRYIYYCLLVKKEYLTSKVRKASIPRLSPSVIKDLEIPLPPLPVQEEIVRALDTFTKLQIELQEELQARQEQFLYYQDILLNKSQYSKHITIGELCIVKKGNTPIQKAKEGKYPLVATTMERRSCDTFQFNANAVCIPLVSSRGHGVASLNHVYYQEGTFALGNILCAVIPNDERVVKAKYLYYYLEYAKDYTLVPLMKGGANVSLHCSDIEKVKIPLPSLSEQERIISILDHFDALTNDLTQGLPAEIEARQQQYEYYRDRLLTFKRKEA